MAQRKDRQPKTSLPDSPHRRRLSFSGTCRFPAAMVVTYCYWSAKGPAQERMTLLSNGVNRTASTANSPPFDVSQPCTEGDRRIHDHVKINTSGTPKAPIAAMAGISGVFGMTPENSLGVCSSA